MNYRGRRNCRRSFADNSLLWRQRRAHKLRADIPMPGGSRLLARIGRRLLERADLLVGRARLRVAHAG